MFPFYTPRKFQKNCFVGNKKKGRISKPRKQESKARQIFRKTDISDPLMRTRMCAYQVVRNVLLTKNFLLVASVLRFTFLRYYRRFGVVNGYKMRTLIQK